MAVLERDPQSIFNLYKRLIVFRRQHAAITEGAYEPISTEGQLLAFARVHDAERLLVTANFGAEPVTIPAAILPPSAIVLMSTHLDRTGPFTSPFVLRPNEGMIVALQSSGG